MLGNPLHAWKLSSLGASYHDKECIGESNKCTPQLYEGHSAVQAYILVYTIEMVIFSLNCNWLSIHDFQFGTSIHAI
ncbi:conserved hypothetical protein [Vibrio chagasii]|nr:conserved hypothetical protein [Vibrio chagasii]CAH7295270.1 conserved hypothetical protein [Vibrio chagasii]CAH7419788.1 conserved hypothetical protein [Vibrio chagasii]CAH7450525.1 conserved hypothetical protein [Vibrio chagasii]